MKKIAVFLSTALLCLGIAFFSVGAVECAEFEGDNVSSQSYNLWSSPVESHLVPADNGQLMRVQYLNENSRVMIEYYDGSYNLLSRKYIETDLPVYGGFFDGGDAYYLLTGQTNRAESDSTEVFRITKYDKSWNKISHAGLYGANTTVPFDAGSARFAKSGKYIIIRTGHEMYKTSDGINHQANVTIQLDSEKMEITDSYTDIMNPNYGYVSHSFNQFVKIENDKIIALDHGDANPRSIVLLKYKTNVSSGRFVPSYYNTCEAVDMLKIAGAVGDNYTGCSVGGFEISSSSYLAAITSIEQGSSSKVKNIYVSVLGKNSTSPTLKKLTNYTDTDSQPSTPHLVKTASDKFMIMWEKGNSVYYGELDKDGNLISNIHSLGGSLSDCVPVISGDKLVWYVWSENDVTFYEVSLNSLENNRKITANSSHNLEISSASGSEVTLKCTKCSETKKGSVPSSFSIWWFIKGGDGFYSSSHDSIYHPGDEIPLWVRFDAADYNEYEVISSNQKAVKISYDYYGDPVAEMIGEGTSKITVRSKYSPEIRKSYTIKVSHSWCEDVTKPTCTQDGKTVKVCSVCGERVTEIVQATGHKMSSPETVKKATCTASGKQTAKCENCDYTESAVIDKLPHDKKTIIKAVSPTCTKSGKTEGKKCSMCGKVTLEQETVPALGHDMGDYETVKEPTCTAQGKKTAACSRCGEEVSEYIVKIDHDKKTIIKAVSPTCTKSGKTEGRKCSMCGKVTLEQEIVSALGHDMGDYKVAKEPTCTAQGKKTAACSRCGEEVSEYIAKFDHDKKTIIKAVSPTCTKSGKTEGKKCSMCGKVTLEQEIVSALGHDMGDYETVKEPTCTAQGKKTAACSRCGEEVSEYIAKIDHDKKTIIKAVSATCTKSGKTEGKKCSMCGKVTLEQETVSALGHAIGDYETVKEPTCTAQGEKAAKCSRCDKSETESIAKLGHSYSEYEITKQATCTAMGEKTAYCERCEKTVTEDIPRLPHKEETIEAVEATCTKAGKTAGVKCALCGRVLKEPETTEKLGHDIKTEVIARATKENHGEILEECARCGDAENSRVYMIKTVKAAKSRYAYDGKTPKVSVKVIDSQKNVLKEGEDYTVSAGDAKKVGTHTAKITFKGKYSGSDKVSFDIVPGRTAKITAAESTSYIKLTWSKVKGATGYRVYKYNSKTKKYEHIASVKGENTYTVKNLKSGTAYKFAIKPYTKLSGGKVYWATSVKAEFATKPAKATIKVVSITNKTAQLSWDKIGGATGYQVYYSTSKSGDYKKLKSTSALSYKKTELKSGKTYYFKVRAYKKAGGKVLYGSFSDIKSVKIR